MRLLVPLGAAAISLWSIFVSVAPITHDSLACGYGLCRVDQMAATVDQEGLSEDNIRSVLIQNPGSPLLWATYGELLASQGNPEAKVAFDHAIELGPNMPPVLMRAANFAFTHGQREQGVLLAKRILSSTDAFDQILFSYLLNSSLPLSEILGSAVPPEVRPACAWLEWIGGQGTLEQAELTWRWMREHNLADQSSAVAMTQALWRHRDYAAAQRVWREWLGAREPGYLHPELVWNPAFAPAILGSPFEWVLDASPTAKLTVKNGLTIQFSGTDNILFSHVRQLVPVTVPGPYTLTVDFESAGLTTDQRPYVRVFDPIGGNLHIPVLSLDNSQGLTRSSVDFSIPAGVALAEIQIERRPSDRYFNKIQGTVTIRRVSLLPRQ